jgi:hypothetical protein
MGDVENKTCADWLTASNGPHEFDNTSRCPKKNEYEEDGERVMATLDSITGNIGARDSGRFV